MRSSPQYAASGGRTAGKASISNTSFLKSEIDNNEYWKGQPVRLPFLLFRINQCCNKPIVTAAEDITGNDQVLT